MQRIAVVGSGVAGLSAAWLLKDTADVTVFEKALKAGGHVNTVDVDGIGIDTGFIVHNDRNYPMFRRFLAHLGVTTQPSDMSFAASLAGGRIEWAGDSLSKLFARRQLLFSPSHWRMLADVVRFNRHAKRLVNDDELPEGSIEEFVAAHYYGNGLLERYLLPMVGAIWSAPTQSARSFPTAALLRFFDNHGLLDLTNRPQWRTIVGGSQRYVDAVAETLGQRLRLDAHVSAIQRSQERAQVALADGRTESFDHVIMACHPPASRQIVADLDFQETRTLAAFSFTDNRAILHTDAELMPRCRRAWSSWNYLAKDTATSNSGVSVSYWMNRLQRLPTTTQYFVSLNPEKTPRSECVISEMRYEHPVYDQAAIEAQPTLTDIQGRGGLWHCGAWCANGFHEDGFASGVRVAHALGADTQCVDPP